VHPADRLHRNCEASQLGADAMSFDNGPESFDAAQRDTIYLKRRVRDEADAAARAGSMAATLIHVALATAYAKRCSRDGDQAWIAAHRAW